MDYIILGFDTYTILLSFFIYSFIGWVWEVFFVFLKTEKLINRGFLNGPFCPIYGLGATVIFLFLSPVEYSLILVFIFGSLIATIIEYMVSAAMEHVFYAKWWDYSNKRYNLKGRICLSVSIGWGFFSIIMLKVFQPILSAYIARIPYTVGLLLIYFAILSLLLDFIYTSYYIKRFDKQIEHLSISKQELRQKLENSKLFEIREELLNKLELNDNDLFEDIRERYFDIKNSTKENIEYFENFIVEFKERKLKYRKFIQDRNFVERRILNAFPNLKHHKNSEIFDEIRKKFNQNK